MAFQLAQANLSRLRHPPSAPRVAEFVAAVDRINHLADRAPGFVWRLRTDVAGDPRLILNVSVWTSYQPLHNYTYRSAHGHFVRRRHEWFDRIEQPSTVLWWLPAGAHPAPAEALARLRHLRRHGPTPPPSRYAPASTRPAPASGAPNPPASRLVHTPRSCPQPQIRAHLP